MNRLTLRNRQSIPFSQGANHDGTQECNSPRQQWLTLIAGILVPMMGAATAAVRDDNV